MKTSLLLITLLIAFMNQVFPIEANFILICGALLLVAPFDQAKFYNNSFLIVLPFLILVLTGVILGLHNTNRDFYRDVFIFLKVIIYFFSGLACTKFLNNINTFFRYFLIFALVSSCIHIATFFININSAVSLEAIRKVAGFGNEAEAIVLAVFLSRMFNKSLRTLIKEPFIFYKLFNLIVAISFLLYFSRTLIVLCVIVSLFLIDVIYIREFFSKKNIGIFKVGVVAFFFCSLILIFASYQSSDSPFVRLVEKFEHIPDEVTWDAKKNQTATTEDINNNWRGYEAYQGLLKFKKGDQLNNIFGYGFGEKVELGISMKLGGEYFEQVPILHNAYVTLLVKCGILGIVCYFWFFYQLGFKKVQRYYNKDLEIYYSCQMLSGLSAATLLNTFTMRGLISSEAATIPLLLGILWGIIERRKRWLRVKNKINLKMKPDSSSLTYIP